jgi:hypothetical protein
VLALHGWMRTRCLHNSTANQKCHISDHMRGIRQLLTIDESINRTQAQNTAIELGGGVHMLCCRYRHVGSAVPVPDLHPPGRPERGRLEGLNCNAALCHARRLCCPPHSLHFVVSGVGSAQRGKTFLPCATVTLSKLNTSA